MTAEKFDFKGKLEAEDRILDHIRACLSTYKTVMHPESPVSERMVIYASSPITSGLRLYSDFVEKGVASVSDLDKERPGRFKEIMNENIDEGLVFGDELRKIPDSLVIVPGQFFAKGWTQEHYMSFWERVITEFADTVCFNDDYHYSNGCVEELLIGIGGGKDLRHRKGFSRLDPREEAKKIRGAIDDMARVGADPSKLYDIYRRLELRL